LFYNPADGLLCNFSVSVWNSVYSADVGFKSQWGSTKSNLSIMLFQSSTQFSLSVYLFISHSERSVEIFSYHCGFDYFFLLSGLFIFIFWDKSYLNSWAFCFWLPGVGITVVSHYAQPVISFCFLHFETQLLSAYIFRIFFITETTPRQNFLSSWWHIITYCITFCNLFVWYQCDRCSFPLVSVPMMHFLCLFSSNMSPYSDSSNSILPFHAADDPCLPAGAFASLIPNEVVNISAFKYHLLFVIN
jgi:hypothetical protein